MDLNKKDNLKKTELFPKDSYFLPERWIIDSSKFDTSLEFTRELSKRGVNRIVQQTFNILIAINILLIVVIAILAFV